MIAILCTALGILAPLVLLADHTRKRRDKR